MDELGLYSIDDFEEDLKRVGKTILLLHKVKVYNQLITIGKYFKLDSEFEKKMVFRWIFNLGDYTLSYEEFEEIVEGATYEKFYGNKILINTYNMKKYDFAIGRATLYTNSWGFITGFYDRFDFDPQDWGKRSLKAEVATRLGYAIGIYSLATPFNIKYP